MAARLSIALVLLVSSLGLAGCFGDDPLSGASVGAGASKANAMLDNPPWANVQPTGVVREFDLYLHPMRHEVYPGAVMGMWGFSLDPDPATATVPGPILRVTEGDTVVVNLQSSIAGFNHTLHWHGQHVPSDMDGVPYLSQEPVEPGDMFTYTFIAKPAGTYWYHCHVDAQHHIDMGMYGVLIVDPQDRAQDPRYDDEFVLVLDDMDRFHVEGGQPVADNMPQSGDPAQWEEYFRRTGSDAVNRNSQVSDRVTGTPLRPPRDWYPVTYAPYTANYNTFTINGFSFPSTPTLVVDEGKTYRIRYVNVANEPFAMHLHGHHVLVTHKDGILLESPYWADTILIGPAERYDVYLRADNPGMWDLHSHIGHQSQNDNIFPGGAMTMLCYRGISDLCQESGGHQHGGGGAGARVPTAGSLLRWYGTELP